MDSNTDLSKFVRNEGGLLAVQLKDLREWAGYQRLGKYVLEEIEGQLDEAGLGFFPLERLHPELNPEPRQWQTLWLYSRDGGTRAQVLDAVLHPLDEDVDVEVALALVSGPTSSMSSDQKLEHIRQIVAD